MIYFDNAATTFPKPDCVIQAVAEGMRTFGNAGRGASEESLGAMRVIYETRVKLASLFGVKNPSRIAFTTNATESLNIAINGLLDVGDHAISTMVEHNSVLRPLFRLEEQGMDLTIIKSDVMGNVNYEDFEHAICENTKAIICVHGSNLTGNCVDIKRVGDIARKHGVLFVVDSSQTAGVLDIDVEEMHIDVLCFTGHKGLMGPQGTGGIYVREGVDVKPLKVGGSGTDSYNQKHPVEMPTALEAGTLNSHGIAGLHAALEYIEKLGVSSIREKEQRLMWRFYHGVNEISNVKVYGDFSTRMKEDRCAIVALSIGDYDSSEVSDELSMFYHISTRAGAHCAPLMHKALGTQENGLVRFSFSHMNTEEEVDIAIRAIEELAKDGE